MASLDMLPDAAVRYMVAAHDAEAATARLRDDEPPLGLEDRESICPACNLVHWSTAVRPCHDCTA